MLEHVKLHSAFQHCRSEMPAFSNEQVIERFKHIIADMFVHFRSSVCVEWISAGTKPTAWSSGSQRKTWHSCSWRGSSLTGGDLRTPRSQGAGWHRCGKCLLAKMQELYGSVQHTLDSKRSEHKCIHYYVQKGDHLTAESTSKCSWLRPWCLLQVEVGF